MAKSRKPKIRVKSGPGPVKAFYNDDYVFHVFVSKGRHADGLTGDYHVLMTMRTYDDTETAYCTRVLDNLWRAIESAYMNLAEEWYEDDPLYIAFREAMKKELEKEEIAAGADDGPYGRIS